MSPLLAGDELCVLLRRRASTLPFIQIHTPFQYKTENAFSVTQKTTMLCCCCTRHMHYFLSFFASIRNFTAIHPTSSVVFHQQQQCSVFLTLVRRLEACYCMLGTITFSPDRCEVPEPNQNIGNIELNKVVFTPESIVYRFWYLLCYVQKA